MISEGSCDTDDWSNDAENSALCHKNKLHNNNNNSNNNNHSREHLFGHI